MKWRRKEESEEKKGQKNEEEKVEISFKGDQRGSQAFTEVKKEK